MTPCLADVCIATGKSFGASAGNWTSIAFFWNGWLSGAGVPTSIIWSYKKYQLKIKSIFENFFCGFTFPPCGPRTANEKSVDGFLFPSSLNCVNAAACPSIGCET